MIDKVYSSIGLQAFAAIITLVQIIMFYGTKKKKNILSSIFVMCSIIILILLIFEIITSIAIIFDFSKIYINVFARIFMILMFFTFFMYSSYVGYLYLANKDDYENVKYKKRLYAYCGITFVISIILSFLFPIEYGCNEEFKICYLHGSFLSTSRLLIFSASIIHSIMLYICVKKGKAKLNMILPLSGILAYSLFYIYFEYYNIDGGFSTFFQALSTTILFLTFENQDSKLIEDQKEINRKLDIASTEKRTFLLNLSHYIRSKYSIILNIAKINLDYNEDKNDFISSDIEQMETNNNELICLSNVIIDLSNISKNIFEKQINKYELIKINNFIVNNAKEFNLKLELKQECENISCNGDINIINKIFVCLFRTLSIMQTYEIVQVIIKNDQNKLFFEVHFNNPSIPIDILNIDDNIIFDKDILSKELELNILLTKKLLFLLNSTLDFKRENNKCVYLFNINQNDMINGGDNNAL